MAEQANPSLPLFPIQLQKVDIGEVSYSCHGFSDSSIAPATEVNLTVSVSPFDEKSRSFQVTLMFKCSSTPPTSPLPYPYSLMMALHGNFQVGDVKRFGLDGAGIEKWGERNGAMVLLPFLRESVYSFTQKTGFQPLLIPLVETTAFKVMPPSQPPTASAAMATVVSEVTPVSE
jgi:preprotein translocase subunit SecB